MLAGQFNRFITFHIASRRYRPSFKHLVEHVGARPSHKVNPGLRPPFIERIVEITSVDDHNGPRSKLQLLSNPYVVGVAVGHQCPTGKQPWWSNCKCNLMAPLVR